MSTAEATETTNDQTTVKPACERLDIPTRSQKVTVSICIGWLPDDPAGDPDKGTWMGIAFVNGKPLLMEGEREYCWANRADALQEIADIVYSHLFSLRQPAAAKHIKTWSQSFGTTDRDQLYGPDGTACQWPFSPPNWPTISNPPPADFTLDVSSSTAPEAQAAAAPATKPERSPPAIPDEKIDPEAEHAAQLAAAEREFHETTLKLIECKKCYKSLQKSQAEAQAKWARLIDRGPERLPLFDNQRAEPAKAPEVPPGATSSTTPAGIARNDPHAAWRGARVEELTSYGLDEKHLARLAKATIVSMGEIDAARDKLAGIKAIGKNPAAAILATFDKWLAAHATDGGLRAKAGRWRERPISVLALPGKDVEKLIDARVITLGDIVDRHHGENGLLSVKNYGRSNEMKLRKTVVKYLAAEGLEDPFEAV